MPDAAESTRRRTPFEFGENWARFLATVDEARVVRAERSLMELLGVNDLAGKRFLDAGSGSGLFSLAAWRLGAAVVSFDADPKSVACTRELRSRWASDDERWTIASGSLLDGEFLGNLGQFDVVYCWGVAHHTGEMWQALEQLSARVAEGGLVAVAIYNDQLYVSRAWRAVKCTYQRTPRLVRPVYVAAIGGGLFLKRLLVTCLAMGLRLVTLRNPLVPVRNWIGESQSRGMHVWYDLVDWVGGWPFEVARPEEVFHFFRDRGFLLRELTTSAGHGCNEFVFQRIQQIPDPHGLVPWVNKIGS